ncbi:MAG: hypothetical protein ACKOC4_03210 [Planctomycetia bacterium]
MTGGRGVALRTGRRGTGMWCLAVLLAAGWYADAAVAAGFRTANFLVDAPTPELARRIGEASEHYRQTLAIEWLGKPLPRWSRPCPIKAQVAPHLGAGGATSFVFDHGEVFNWTMTIQGSEERIIDSVLPHEITHTIFASHFRRPLPRWADEGACTTVEHPVERARQHRMLVEFLTTRRGIAFPEMFAMREYPADVLPLYAQGYSLARYLIERGGRHTYVNFVADGLATENWSAALDKHYGVKTVAQMQSVWLDWVKQGCPAPPAALAVASPPPADWAPTARVQSPDPVPAAAAAQPVGPVASTVTRTSIYAQARRAAESLTTRR